MKTNKSIFFNLLAPICLITLSLLCLATMAISAVYVEQTEKAQIQSNLEILRQTGVSLELLHGHVAKVASDFSEKPYMRSTLEQPLDSAMAEYESRKKLSSLFSASPSAMVDYEMTIVGANGIAVSSGNGGVTLDAEKIMELPVFLHSVDSGHVTYGSSLSGLSYDSRGKAVILGCKALCEDGKPYGGILISIRESSVRQFYQNFISGKNNITLLNEDGTILSSTMPEVVGTQDVDLLSVARSNRESGTDYSRGKDKHIVLSQYLPYMDAYILSQLKPPAFLGTLRPHGETVAIIMLALTALIVMIAWVIRQNLKPLRLLASHMAAADTVPTPIHLDSSSEMKMITTAYNKMVDTIDEYLRKLNAAHDKRRKDELNLLQMQINPHFLYNTLDSIKFLVSTANPQEACTTITALTTLLRSTLGKTDTLVLVSDEVLNVQNYIDIIKPRYGGMIQAEIHADQEALGYLIPNLLLQPFVENAFFHAFQKTKSGSIHVFITCDGTGLSCEILDNGDGILPEQLEKLLQDEKPHPSATRIGIANVRERLEILFPGQNSFQMTSEPGYGTSIQISFPAIPKNPI